MSTEAGTGPVVGSGARAGQTLDAAVAQFCAQRPLLVGTDFDGVLAPLVADPARARPLPGMMDDLRAIAAMPRVTVALVSGRDLSSLRKVTGVTEEDSGIVLICSHGAESTSDAVREAMVGNTIRGDHKARLADLTSEISSLVAERHPRARLEHKAAAIAVHTRGLPAEDARAAIEDARKAALRHRGVRVLAGKDVLELSVSHADKGTAFTALGRDLGATARMYFGDDTTDEDVFARLRGENDVTVKVGTGSTAARYRVADEQAVAQTLRTLTHLL